MKNHTEIPLSSWKLAKKTVIYYNIRRRNGINDVGFTCGEIQSVLDCFDFALQEKFSYEERIAIAVELSAAIAKEPIWNDAV